MAPLVVATCNIRNGRALDGRNAWPFRRRALVEVLDGLGADVLALQEVYTFQQRFLLAHLPGLAAVGEGRDGDGRGERCPLLHRTARLRLDAHRTCWFGDRSDGPGRLPGARFPRVATIATYTDREGPGGTFAVANVHLDERHHDLRVRSVEQLAGWLRVDTATIVLGDFNSDADDVMAPLVCLGLRRVLAPGSPGTAHDFRGGGDGARLDHVLVSRHFHVQRAEVVMRQPSGRPPSDHWPVRVELCGTSA